MMMVSALVFVGATSASAIGLGVVFGGSASWNGWGGSWGAGFSLGVGSLEDVDWELAVRASGGNGRFWVGLDLDWHLYQYNFTDWVAFYVGVGPYVGLAFGSKDSWYNPVTGKNEKYGGYFGLDVGARVPVGFRFMLADMFDIWIAFVPNVGLGMTFYNKDYYGNKGSNSFGIGGGIGGEIGFRFWF
ncbi:hypothetical protein [Entomospira culicis]|uniref:Uncharacterized protein n=1 Tax=Entomospira culicis TaxID=2719989 RepID=A0A968GEP0_9SPIO|nr:hypothetical protein [Entomospira culicis]NIZ18662.1 hypothetical protein [Entomospira culicis]NIZ68877.1 hypothetical protein [Entomospira culicis]WDI37470.1 hypothetical protein PVA46_01395 [Entomospira culicis]WDI39098.1 hypothetical protein PVA47_01400 [Entomospira culicis]